MTIIGNGTNGIKNRLYILCKLRTYPTAGKSYTTSASRCYTPVARTAFTAAFNKEEGKEEN